MKTICRILSCLLVLVMMFSVVACTGSTDPTSTPATSDTSTTEASTTKAPASSTEAPTTTAPATDTTKTPVTTETPTQADVDGKPEINETFWKEVNGEQVATTINFYVNGGEEDSLTTRSIALVADIDGNLPDMDYEPNKMTLQRNQTIKSEIGTDIVVKKIGTMQGTATELKPILQAQEAVYDVFALYQYYDLGLALTDTVGSFYNFENMPEGYTNYLRLNAPYWNQGIYETMKLRDPDTGNTVCFFLTGDLTQTNVGNMFVSYVNQRLWNDYKDEIAKLATSGGYTDIYDIVNNGYWTMDLWCDLADLLWIDTNPNETPDKDDQLGVISYCNKGNYLCNMTVEYFSYGAHVMYTELDDEGRPVAAMNSTHNMEFYNKLYTLMCETKTGLMQYDDAEGENIMDYFARGNVLATVNELQKAETYLQGMDDDYWVMPLPMLNREQFDKDAPSLGYTTGIGDSLTQFAICVFGGDERIPAITATLELMGYYSKEWVTPAYYEMALKTRFIRDDDGKNAEMLDVVHNGIYSTFGFVWSEQLGNVTFVIREKYDKISSIATDMKMNNKNLQSKLTKLLRDIMTAWFVNY